MQSWIENGLVTVNGASIRRASSRAAFGDVVSIALPDELPRAVMAAEDVRLQVLYEDGDLAGFMGFAKDLEPLIKFPSQLTEAPQVDSKIVRLVPKAG